MANTTSEQQTKEKEHLAQLLRDPILIRAIEGALSDTWREKRGQTTLESSALAFQYYDGICEFVAKLYSKSQTKPAATVATKRLRHNAI